MSMRIGLLGGIVVGALVGHWNKYLSDKKNIGKSGVDKAQTTNKTTLMKLLRPQELH